MDWENFLPRPTLMENNLQGLSVRIITPVMCIHMMYSKLLHSIYIISDMKTFNFHLETYCILSGFENLQLFTLSTEIGPYLHIHSFTELHPWKRKMERSRKSEINEFWEISWMVVGITFCLLTQKQEFGHVYVLSSFR